MTDDVPPGGAPLGLEMDPKFKSLPLGIRPFDPEMYNPEVHVLPPGGIRQGPPATRAGVTLILQHSHAFRGYGNIIARDWHMELPDVVCHIVDEAGFGAFCMGLSHLTTSRPLLGPLVERWWDTTDSFHLSTAGEMTMTPFDFSMLTGIGVGGDPIP
ncbi:hypothetical protein CsSME_00028491 [Camellia sinensis var. sinensis]